MGSRDMAVTKILSVLLVAGSVPAWTSPQFSSSTTPVPILRYVDNQNIDGSYTYGYEAADGSYKLETRHQDGRVKGKYGYIDPEGNLREASYGAEAGRGFEPQIAGLELPPPVVAEVEAVNEIRQKPQVGEVRIINGRKALVKKVRKLKATPAPRKFIASSAQRDESLSAREQGLRTLEQQRRKLIDLQKRQFSQNRQQQQQQPRSFSNFPQARSGQQESFRSVIRPTAAANAKVNDPYISGLDLSSGSYSYSY